MHFILIGKDGAKFYLLPNTSYTVGRKDCDLLIVRDESISRRHAELVVTNDKVSIMDVGSRYGTFINNTKLTINASSVLQDGATVKFGMLQSIYKFQAVSIVNTTSGIKSEHKTQLKDNMVTLGGLLVQNWKKDCNYVTVEEMMLTVKVLSAVIAGVPIVNVSYWDDYVKCVKAHEPLPDVKNYVPKCSEVIINDNISFEYKEERRELFKNKLFVFPKKSDNEKMVGLINLAGGDSVSWDIHPISVEKIANEDSKDYIVMQTSNINDNIKQNPSLADFLHHYTKLGNRTIPLQEIALAIINCSCEKDCNPKFNRKACVFKASTQQVARSEACLAMPTQSMDVMSEQVNFKSETVIPQSYDVDMNVTNKTELSDDVVYEETTDDRKAVVVISDSSSPVKRESDSNHNERESKRIKVDESLKEDQSETLQEQKVNTQKPVSGKSLFAFAHTNIAAENSNSSAIINPFSRKRKAEPNVQANSSKGQTGVDNATSPVSDQRQTVDSTKVTSTPKPKPKGSVPANELNSLEVDFSAIPVVDSGLEKSFQWYTRSADKSMDSTTKSEDDMDEDMLRFINSFKDAIIVETEDMVIKKEKVVGNGVSCLSDVTNFKRFKKVQPLHKQKIIIPESKYVSIVCSNNNEGEEYVQDLAEEQETDNMDSEPIRPVGRQYVF
ncbi:nibrin isoform X2 [Photinus pyralis]|uniref:nibrin isoform X2 n=1 Tax=Photinus pyralis TaxID=7054 RepID=UPI001267819D|nr:nibrin isoform X2 [Photinus pyralis]